MNRNRKVKRNRRTTAAAVLAVSTAMMFSGTSLPVLAANTTVVSGQQAGTWQEARIGGITWGYQVDSEGQAVRLYAKSGNISGALDEKGNLIIPGQVGGHSVASIGGGSISQPVFSAGNANKTVTGIVLPATVSKIEDYAFYNVTMAPQSVTIPGTVKSIGSYAFAGSGIRELSLAGFTGSIGDGAFSACAYLTSAYIQTDNGSALTLGKNAFANDTALSSLVINNAGTLNIGDYAFSSSGINSLILDGTVKVGASAFAGCNRLTGVSIGKNVSFDGGTPFEGCSILSDVSTDADLKDDVFSGCDSIGQLFVKGDVRNVSAKWNGSNVTGRTLNVYVLSPETKFGSTPTLSAFGGSISKTSVFYANGGAVKTGKAEAGNYDCATYAQNDDWKDLAVANVSFYSGTFTQDGNSYTFKADDGSTFNANDGMNASATIRASYSGALRTGQAVQRDNVTVMNTKTGEKISEFYVLRKTDADSLMNKYGNADALKTALKDVKDVRADSSDLMTADGASGILYASVISFVDGKAVQSDLNIRVEKTNIDPEDADYKTFEDMLNQINNLKIRSILLDNAVRRADDTNTIVTAMSKDEYKKDADTVSNVLKLAATPVDTLSSDGQKVLDAALAGLSDTDKAAVKDAMADYAQTSSKGTVEDIFYTYLTRTCKMSDSDAKALLTADLTSDDTATQGLLEKLTSDQRNKAKELSTANDGYKSMSSDLKQAIDDEEKVILSLADQTINLTSLKDYTTKAGQLKTALETAQSEIEKAKEQYNGLAEALKKYAATHTAGNIDFVGTQTTDGKDVVYLNGTAFPYDKDSGTDTEVTLEDGTHTVKAYNAVGSPWKYQGDVSVEKGTFKFYAMLDGIHVISATDENGKALSIDPNKENSAQTPLGGVFTQSLTTALNNAVNSADSAFSAISSADEAMASYINAMVESGLLDKAQKIDLTGDTGTDTTKIADAMKALTNAYSAYRTQYTKYQEGHTLTTDQVNDLLSTVNNLRDKADNVESYVTKLMTDKNLTDGDKSKLTDVLTAAVNIKNTALDDENYFKSLKNAFSIAENTSNSRAAQQIVNTVTDLRNQVS
ncbi:MAG: leucine-rich repeat protein, partial [Bilifractor sp.]